MVSERHVDGLRVSDLLDGLVDPDNALRCGRGSQSTGLLFTTGQQPTDCFKRRPVSSFLKLLRVIVLHQHV